MKMGSSGVLVIMVVFMVLLVLCLGDPDLLGALVGGRNMLLEYWPFIPVIILVVVGVCILNYYHREWLETKIEIVRDTFNPYPRGTDSQANYHVAGEVYSCLYILYNNVGLFIKQYYDSESAHNYQKSKLLNNRLKELAVLVRRYESTISEEIGTDIFTLIGALCNYKERVENIILCDGDVEVYKCWLRVNVEFGERVLPMLKKLERTLGREA